MCTANTRTQAHKHTVIPLVVPLVPSIRQYSDSDAFCKTCRDIMTVAHITKLPLYSCNHKGILLNIDRDTIKINDSRIRLHFIQTTKQSLTFYREPKY